MKTVRPPETVGAAYEFLSILHVASHPTDLIHGTHRIPPRGINHLFLTQSLNLCDPTNKAKLN